MLETQLAQLAVVVPSFKQGRIPSQLENVANVSVVTMRGGKSTRNPPHPNMTGKTTKKD
jgi:hypothetical protein